MADSLAFHAVGEALRTYLDSTYPQQLRAQFECTFSLVSTGQLSKFADPTDSSATLTLFLYRVTVNEQLRNSLQPGRTPFDVAPALPVDLHWMLTVWSTSAAAEHIVLAWAMRQLNQRPLFDASVLPEAAWHRDDVVHVLPEELPLEDLMRIWEAIEPSYRLSTSYVTRVVRLDSEPQPIGPVLERRLELPRRGGRQ